MVKCNQVLELKVAQNFQKSPNLSDCRGSQKVGGNDALMFSSLGVNFKKSRNQTPIKLFQFGLKRLFPSLVSRNFCWQLCENKKLFEISKQKHSTDDIDI